VPHLAFQRMAIRYGQCDGDSFHSISPWCLLESLSGLAPLTVSLFVILSVRFLTLK